MPGTPSAILEAGYLTSAVDRQILLNDPQASARGIAIGLLRYLDIPE
jgi:N-acetylmuramoyl-L-alanine amidase